MQGLGNIDQPALIFTFFSEKEGSTVIEQFSGEDLHQALLAWHEGSIVKPGMPLEGDEPTPVETAKNVWCISGHDPEGKFFLTHIVATAL